MPEKFSGNDSEFQGFLDQVQLIIQMQPHRYSMRMQQIGLLTSLLTRLPRAWVAPLLERNDPVLQDLNAFVKVFYNCFADSDLYRSSVNKLCRLTQGSHPTSTYITEFQ